MTHTIPPDTLAQLDHLYGLDWPAFLAAATARKRQTCTRWRDGETPMPRAVREWVKREFEESKQPAAVRASNHRDPAAKAL